MQPHQALETRLQSFPKEEVGSENHVDLLLELAWEIALIDPPRSAKLTAEAREFSEKLGYAKGVAYCLRNEGYGNVLSAQLEKALVLLTEALTFFTSTADDRGRATALDTLGFTHLRLGDYERAHSLSLESLELNRKIGNRRGEAWALHNIAGIHNDTGAVDEAIKHYKLALKIFDEIDYLTGTSRVLNCLGDCYYAKGNLEQALSCNMESMHSYKKAKLAIGILGSQVAIARILADMEDFAGAEKYYQAAIATLQPWDHVEAQANARLRYGDFCLKQGNDTTGLALLQEALQLIDGTTARQTALKIHEVLYLYYEERGQLGEALHHYKRFRELKEKIFSEKSGEKLKNMQILMDLERAEKEAEIHRLKYTELAEMQAELVQTERLALLGNLVAGIAHEVNTPIGVINSSADVSRRAVEKIRSDLQSREAGKNEETFDSLHKTLQLIRDNNAATLEAGHKISSLVKRLKSFASLDEAAEQLSDISEGLEDTLALLLPKLPDGIKIVKSLAELPPIRCFPQALNQVFMTLISNAIDAIDSIGTVSVTTGVEQNRVVIEISDTGRGIQEGQLEKIFDVGFSRKNQTIRMNVGLANAHNIVQKHNGQIEVRSKPGFGSQFIIRLPISR